MKGGPFSLARYCMLRGKKEKPFWFSFPGQQVKFGAFLFRRTFVELLVKLFWSFQVYRKKSRTKIHDYSRLIP